MKAMLEQCADNILDCWNRIGVWGRQQPRCEKLDTVIHCRNCDIYSSSGRKILARGLSGDQINESTLNLAQPKSTKVLGSETGLIFRIGKEWVMINADSVNEITPRTSIHRLPHQSDPILLGLANIRGELKICISLAHLLEIDIQMEAANDSGQRIYPRMLVAGKSGEEFVFPVNEIKGTHRYHPNDLQPSPATVSRSNPTYTRGVLDLDGRHIAWLDSELLFYAIGHTLK